MLAQVRRSGRWESIGHGRKSTRPSGSGRLTVPVGQRVGIERLVDVVELGADLLEVLDDGIQSRSVLGGRLGSATLDGRLGDEGVGLGLQVRYLGFRGRSISRRTSASGGARAPASAALGVSSGTRR